MIVGYLRVSTERQHPANQQDEIRRFAKNRNWEVDVWVTEVVSGKTRERDRKLGTLLRRMKRGDSIMLGYYKDPEATAAVIDKDGWFHTGDLARVDEDGYYYITGRKKNLIILDSGENLSPEELEGMLEKCPAVQECIVKELGKKIGVVVYCEKEHQQTVRDFIAQMNRTIPLYKRIGVVEFSETPLPRNATGKLVRK